MIETSRRSIQSQAEFGLFVVEALSPPAVNSAFLNCRARDK
jgi:hypothetical protein